MEPLSPRNPRVQEVRRLARQGRHRADRRAFVVEGQILLDEAIAAQNAVTLSLQRLQEAYPDLKSNQNFLSLQDQLEGTENRIAVARTDYIEAVRSYNTTRRRFPTSLIAGMLGGSRLS